MKNKKQDSEILVPVGYELTEMVDTDDSGYDYENDAVYCEEVKVRYE